MSWVNGSSLDLWTADVQLTPEPSPSHFGHDGRYVYRYQLLGTDGRPIAFWFPDPFARETGIGTLSAFTADSLAQPFPWSDAAFVPPEVDDMVVYEMNIREFNSDFDGLTTQLDYVKGLGVNVLELMPISNVKEVAECGSYEGPRCQAPLVSRETCTPPPLRLQRTPREQDPSASVAVTLPIARPVGRRGANAVSSWWLLVWVASRATTNSYSCQPYQSWSPHNACAPERRAALTRTRPIYTTVVCQRPAPITGSFAPARVMRTSLDILHDNTQIT
jgi:hypothetical protein